MSTLAVNQAVSFYFAANSTRALRSMKHKYDTHTHTHAQSKAAWWREWGKKKATIWNCILGIYLCVRNDAKENGATKWGSALWGLQKKKTASTQPKNWDAKAQSHLCTSTHLPFNTVVAFNYSPFIFFFSLFFFWFSNLPVFNLTHADTKASGE